MQLVCQTWMTNHVSRTTTDRSGRNIDPARLLETCICRSVHRLRTYSNTLSDRIGQLMVSKEERAITSPAGMSIFCRPQTRAASVAAAPLLLLPGQLSLMMLQLRLLCCWCRCVCNPRAVAAAGDADMRRTRPWQSRMSNLCLVTRTYAFKWRVIRLYRPSRVQAFIVLNMWWSKGSFNQTVCKYISDKCDDRKRVGGHSTQLFLYSRRNPHVEQIHHLYLSIIFKNSDISRIWLFGSKISDPIRENSEMLTHCIINWRPALAFFRTFRTFRNLAVILSLVK